MRFWLVELPAQILNGLLMFYATFIGVVVVLSLGMTTVQVAAFLLGLPIPWLGQPHPVSLVAAP
jgi:hypothetical protein